MKIECSDLCHVQQESEIKIFSKDRDPLVTKFIDDDPPNECIIDDDAPAQQPEVDAQMRVVVEEEEEEEFQSSASEHKEEENIPYADGSSDHELDEVGDNDNE
uniref:Uncharacterized protein n=1 Tax=Oryza punctata TaxID=4537 RepID=A0A0E0LM62_ORYPU